MKKKKRKEKIKLKLKCFERKAKFALQIAPEGNNEEKSCTGEKKKTLCSKSWNLALSNTHQRAESQKKANVSQHPHAGGGVSVIIQLLVRSSEKMDFPLTEQMIPGVLLSVQFNNLFFSDYDYQPPIFVENGY